MAYLFARINTTPDATADFEVIEILADGQPSERFLQHTPREVPERAERLRSRRRQKSQMKLATTVATLLDLANSRLSPLMIEPRTRRKKEKGGITTNGTCQRKHDR